MLKILGRLSSVNVQKVVWCADELGLAYERVDVGGSFGGNRTPEYLAMNPNGLVPVIREDDGFVLYESNAIVRYLAAKDERASLWPRDPRKRADVDRGMEWQSTSLTPAMVLLDRRIGEFLGRIDARGMGAALAVLAMLLVGLGLSGEGPLLVRLGQESGAMAALFVAPITAALAAGAVARVLGAPRSAPAKSPGASPAAT